jgi:hypothetical protein
MSLRQIATINRPLVKDNKLLVGYFIERWAREGETSKLVISFYKNGYDIPFDVYTIEKAPNRKEILILLNEDRDVLGAFLSKDPVENIIEEIARNTNVEETFKVEIEEEVAEE